MISLYQSMKTVSVVYNEFIMSIGSFFKGRDFESRNELIKKIINFLKADSEFTNSGTKGVLPSDCLSTNVLPPVKNRVDKKTVGGKENREFEGKMKQREEVDSQAKKTLLTGFQAGSFDKTGHQSKPRDPIVNELKSTKKIKYDGVQRKVQEIYKTKPMYPPYNPTKTNAQVDNSAKPGIRGVEKEKPFRNEFDRFKPLCQEFKKKPENMNAIGKNRKKTIS